MIAIDVPALSLADKLEQSIVRLRLEAADLRREADELDRLADADERRAS